MAWNSSLFPKCCSLHFATGTPRRQLQPAVAVRRAADVLSACSQEAIAHGSSRSSCGAASDSLLSIGEFMQIDGIASGRFQRYLAPHVRAASAQAGLDNRPTTAAEGPAWQHHHSRSMDTTVTHPSFGSSARLFCAGTSGPPICRVRLSTAALCTGPLQTPLSSTIPPSPHVDALATFQNCLDTDNNPPASCTPLPRRVTEANRRCWFGRPACRAGRPPAAATEQQVIIIKMRPVMTMTHKPVPSWCALPWPSPHASSSPAALLPRCVGGREGHRREAGGYSQLGGA